MPRSANGMLPGAVGLDEPTAAALQRVYRDLGEAGESCRPISIEAPEFMAVGLAVPCIRLTGRRGTIRESDVRGADLSGFTDELVLIECFVFGATLPPHAVLIDCEGASLFA